MIDEMQIQLKKKKVSPADIEALKMLQNDHYS